MDEKIVVKELHVNDMYDEMLISFNRYQKVTRIWFNNNGEWQIKDHDYIEDWDEAKKIERAKQFKTILAEHKGSIFGAYDEHKLIGFSVIIHKFFGSDRQYVQLKYLHVSLEYRHKGIGKELFKLSVEKARDLGAKKLYISANDSEETQKFYLGIGCVDAVEINEALAQEEPYDRQMEYPV
ncbi:MAG: GNAT family N-acetyltransferase [Treponema sp.]|nr:GNAT family N-acetyltransferase [Treponema sp.]